MDLNGYADILNGKLISHSLSEAQACLDEMDKILTKDEISESRRRAESILKKLHPN